MAGYSSRRKLEDLDLTKHELDQIGDALKKEEFRKLLVDYVQEINDPENKKLFQKEVTQLEKERGYDVTFINPEPGYVIKTSVDDEKKAFINVCKSDKVQKPSSVTGVKEGSYGRKWSLPYTQAPPQEDFDSEGKRCVIFDIVFHPEALDMAGWNVQFRNMLNETALDGVENNFNVKLDRNNLKFPKMKYKGSATATVIRKKLESFKPDDDFQDVLTKMNYPYNETEPQPVPKNTMDKKQNTEAPVNKSPYTTPKYIIKHRNVVDYQDFMNDRNAKLNVTVPKEIIVEIDLPLLSSTTEAVLDVTERSLSLTSEKPAKYKLYIMLPYIVDEDAGNAKFDKIKRKLQITLPLKHCHNAPFADFGREDSGVESDIGMRSAGSSSGEDDNIDNERKKLTYKDISHNVISKIEEINGDVNGGDQYEDPRSKSIECSENFEQTELNIEVTKCTKDETVVEITPVGKNMENLHDEKGSESSEDNTGHEIFENKKSGRHPMLQKCRTLSESSGDEMSFSPSKRGILKRVSRSLSESSADDYTWSSSLDMIMQSGSDSCIPEEEGLGMKKTVRFNEIVHQQTYRCNSSIFGQKKKNQRKTRNKKRAQERRASESENSEGEGDKDGENGVKTEKNEENEEEEEVNGDDDSPEANDGDEVYEVELKLQDEKTKTTNKKNSLGQTLRKGKKKSLKPAAAPESKKEDPKVELKNELIFDLDM